jgi:hypothetical protein
MIHPATELRLVSAQIGYGVYATRRIPKGTLTYVRDAMEVIIAPDSPLITDPLYSSTVERYSYIEPTGNRVISWDIAKYVNHSCDFNTISTGYGFELAVRDIEAGEEITDDYGLFNMTEPLVCYCGSAKCRSVITPDQMQRFRRRYDAIIKDALSHLTKVEQPLLGFLDEQNHASLLTYLHTGRRYRSVMALACATPAQVAMAAGTHSA